MQRIVSRLIGAVVCVGLLALVGAAGASARNPVRGAAARERTLHSMLASGAVQPQDDASSTNHVPDNDEADESGDVRLRAHGPGSVPVSGQALISAQQQAQGLGEIAAGLAAVHYAALQRRAGWLLTIRSSPTPAPGRDCRRSCRRRLPRRTGAGSRGRPTEGCGARATRARRGRRCLDSMPSLSIGALTVDPVDGSIWVGTGEANLSTDSYAGTGIYRSSNDGASWQRIGDSSTDGTDPIVVDHGVQDHL